MSDHVVFCRCVYNKSYKLSPAKTALLLVADQRGEANIALGLVAGLRLRGEAVHVHIQHPQLRVEIQGSEFRFKDARFRVQDVRSRVSR